MIDKLAFIFIKNRRVLMALSSGKNFRRLDPLFAKN